MAAKIKISRKVMTLAKAYAQLTPETGYPDMNAAIAMAKFIVRLTKQ